MAVIFRSDETSRGPSRAESGWEGDGWREAAACRDLDGELFFPAGETGLAAGQILRAKAVCRSCPVADECLDFALASHQSYGIWGGTTEEERRQIRRDRRAAATRRAS